MVRAQKNVIIIYVITLIGIATIWFLWYYNSTTRSEQFHTIRKISEKIIVPCAEAIDPISTLISLDVNNGKTFLDGELISISDLRKKLPPMINPSPPSWLPRFLHNIFYKNPGSMRYRRDPVVIESSPAATFHDVNVILEYLIINGWINISFLVQSSEGDGVVSICIPDINSCYVRRSIIKQFPMREDELWIIIRIDTGGKIVVKDIVQGLASEKFITAINNNPKLPKIWRWSGDHPSLGPWSKEVLKSFISDPIISALDPFIILKVEGTETVFDVVRCLVDLRSVTEDHVILEISPR